MRSLERTIGRYAVRIAAPELHEFSNENELRCYLQGGLNTRMTKIGAEHSYETRQGEAKAESNHPILIGRQLFARKSMDDHQAEMKRDPALQGEPMYLLVSGHPDDLYDHVTRGASAALSRFARMPPSPRQWIGRDPDALAALENLLDLTQHELLDAVEDSLSYLESQGVSRRIAAHTVLDIMGQYQAPDAEAVRKTFSPLFPGIEELIQEHAGALLSRGQYAKLLRRYREVSDLRPTIFSIKDADAQNRTFEDEARTLVSVSLRSTPKLSRAVFMHLLERQEAPLPLLEMVAPLRRGIVDELAMLDEGRRLLKATPHADELQELARTQTAFYARLDAEQRNALRLAVGFHATHHRFALGYLNPFAYSILAGDPSLGLCALAPMAYLPEKEIDRLASLSEEELTGRHLLTDDQAASIRQEGKSSLPVRIAKALRGIRLGAYHGLEPAGFLERFYADTGIPETVTLYLAKVEVRDDHNRRILELMQRAYGDTESPRAFDAREREELMRLIDRDADGRERPPNRRPSLETLLAFRLEAQVSHPNNEQLCRDIIGEVIEYCHDRLFSFYEQSKLRLISDSLHRNEALFPQDFIHYMELLLSEHLDIDDLRLKGPEERAIMQKMLTERTPEDRELLRQKEEERKALDQYFRSFEALYGGPTTPAIARALTASYAHAVAVGHDQMQGKIEEAWSKETKKLDDLKRAVKDGRLSALDRIVYGESPDVFERKLAEVDAYIDHFNAAREFTRRITLSGSLDAVPFEDFARFYRARLALERLGHDEEGKTIVEKYCFELPLQLMSQKPEMAAQRVEDDVGWGELNDDDAAPAGDSRTLLKVIRDTLKEFDGVDPEHADAKYVNTHALDVYEAISDRLKDRSS